MIYEPREDSLLVQESIKRYARGSILDMGTGSGILAREAFNYSKEVTAVDINPEALDHAKKNSDKKIIFKQSDLFQNVKEKYQLIIFNPPYLPEDKAEDRESSLITSGGKHGYELIEKFMASVNDHLEDDGKILLVFSSLTNKDMVDEIISKNLFDFTLLQTQMLPMFEQLYLYSVEKTSLLKELCKIKELRFFAKGHRGYIYTGKIGTKKVAIKLKNPKSKASGRIQNEVNFLKVLNKKDIGPNLVKSSKDYFVYEFIEGIFLPKYIQENTKEPIKKVLVDILKQCHEMDLLKVNKEEMHNPYKHIIIDSKGHPTLIDFERSLKTAKPHNVTQFCQYLAVLKPELKRKNVHVIITRIRELARDYKKSYDRKVLDNIIKSIL
ncbi:MAG: HemK2/MTQ2 family protein methyltransferase [Candidatus Woesearchaeota archaeon]